MSISLSCLSGSPRGFALAVASLCALGSTPIRAQASDSLFVSPSGVPGNCTRSVPCRLVDARDRLRAFTTPMTRDVLVLLRGGRYELASPLLLDARDGGRNGFSVIYRAFPGEQPVLSGGRRISNWQVHDPVKGIHKADVGSLDFRQLYVAGKRAIRSREPNLRNERNFGPYHTALGNNPYVVKSSEVAQWNNIERVEFVWPSHWLHKRVRLKSFTTTGGSSTLAFQSPETDQVVRDAFNQDQPISRAFYHWENAYEFLDTTGEWYLDKGTLYAIPPAGVTLASAEVVAPVATSLVQADGASRIHLDGLTFQHSNWTGPNTCGYLNWQAGLGNVPCDQDVPGMVHFRNSSDIQVKNCLFENSGAHGLLMNGFALRNLVSRNVFRDMASGGVYVVSDSCRNLEILDNLVERVGGVYRDACGILVTRPRDMTIAHNEVRNASYTGISVGWDWNSTDKGLNNNDIHHNLVHDFMEAQDDGGGIYTLGRMDSTRIRDNHIHSAWLNPYSGGWGVNAVYLDEGSANKLVENNVIANVGGGSIYVKGTNNRIVGNYYNLAGNGPSGSGIASGNTEVSGENWPPAARAIMAAAGIRKAGSVGISRTSKAGTSSGFALTARKTGRTHRFMVALPTSGPVVLTVHDVAGNRLFSMSRMLEAGEHPVEWSDAENHAAAGTLLVSARFGSETATGKILR